MSFCCHCGKEIEEGRFLCDECMNSDAVAEETAENDSPAPDAPTPDAPVCEEAIEPIPEKPKYTAEKGDLILAALLTVPSIMLVNATLFSGIGLFFTIASLLISAISIVYAVKSQNAKITVYSIILAILSVFSSITFMLSCEKITKGFLLPTLFILYMTFLTETFSQRTRKPGTFRAVSDLMKTVFVFGLGKLSHGGWALFRRTDSEGNVSRRKIGNVFIGIAVALPVILIVVPLLVSSDAAFESLLNKLSFDNAAEVIFSVATGLFITLITFSRLFSLRHLEPKEISEPSGRGADPVALVSFLGAIGAVYVVYLFSQLAYFFSAFSRLLPDDFTASEYARRGFFEMCAVCAINLGVIFLSSAICRKGENGLPTGVKALNVFLSAFSVILIITALSKMVLYIDLYGMTRLRIYTSLFMLALAIIFITVSVKLFIRKTPYMKIILVSVAALLMVTCLADADRIIANYNVSAYLSGELVEMDISTLSKLNDTATKPLLRLLREADDETVKAAAGRALCKRFYKHYSIVQNTDGTSSLEPLDDDIRNLNIPEALAVEQLYKARNEYLSYHNDNSNYNY